MNGNLFPELAGDAVMDESRCYRYRLSRGWFTGPTVAFVMLNPSTADDQVDDQTIRRCVGFGRSWGFGRLEVVNLFAWRATKPSALLAAPDPVGPSNDASIVAVADRSTMIVLAWGAMLPQLRALGRVEAVVKLLRPWRASCHALEFTTTRSDPRHPLYVRGDVMPCPVDLEKL